MQYNSHIIFCVWLIQYRELIFAYIYDISTLLYYHLHISQKLKHEFMNLNEIIFLFLLVSSPPLFPSFLSSLSFPLLFYQRLLPLPFTIIKKYLFVSLPPSHFLSLSISSHFSPSLPFRIFLLPFLFLRNFIILSFLTLRLPKNTVLRSVLFLYFGNSIFLWIFFVSFFAYSFSLSLICIIIFFCDHVASVVVNEYAIIYYFFLLLLPFLYFFLFLRVSFILFHFVIPFYFLCIISYVILSFSWPCAL